MLYLSQHNPVNVFFQSMLFYFLYKQSCIRSWSLFLFTGKTSQYYKSMKADKWCLWTHVHSLYVLTDIILKKHLIVCSMFVSACHNVYKKVSVWTNSMQAAIFLELCRLGFLDYVVANIVIQTCIYIHVHLKNCLLEYGPKHAFWCFSYECFNGFLGAYHINNHSIAIELMRKINTVSQMRNTSDFGCFQ